LIRKKENIFCRQGYKITDMTYIIRKELLFIILKRKSNL